VAEALGMTRFDRKVPDHISVDAMMMEMIKMGDKSPVLFYRPATASQKLIVVLQTDSMRRAMLEHGPFLLVVDTTHDASRYPGTFFGLFHG
jgi:hypothetical protein